MAVTELNIVGQTLAATLEERVRLRECSGFFILKIIVFYIKEEMKMENLANKGFIVLLDTDDENEYNNPPEFRFETYKEMDDFIQLVLLHCEKDLKIIITKGDN
jgi:hypothetical protein